MLRLGRGLFDFKNVLPRDPFIFNAIWRLLGYNLFLVCFPKSQYVPGL